MEKTIGQSWLPDMTRHNPTGFPIGFLAGFRPETKINFIKTLKQSGQQSGQDLVEFAAGFGPFSFLQDFFFFPSLKATLLRSSNK